VVDPALACSDTPSIAGVCERILSVDAREIASAGLGRLQRIAAELRDRIESISPSGKPGGGGSRLLDFIRVSCGPLAAVTLYRVVKDISTPILNIVDGVLEVALKQGPKAGPEVVGGLAGRVQRELGALALSIAEHYREAERLVALCHDARVVWQDFHRLLSRLICMTAYQFRDAYRVLAGRGGGGPYADCLAAAMWHFATIIALIGLLPE
jgi:hypothetical protein